MTWTYSDANMLQALVQKQMKRHGCVDFGLIAQLLDRTERACTSKCFSMGIKYQTKPVKHAIAALQPIKKKAVDVLAAKGVRYDLGRHVVHS